MRILVTLFAVLWGAFAHDVRASVSISDIGNCVASPQTVTVPKIPNYTATVNSSLGGQFTATVWRETCAFDSSKSAILIRYSPLVGSPFIASGPMNLNILQNGTSYSGTSLWNNFPTSTYGGGYWLGGSLYQPATLGLMSGITATTTFDENSAFTLIFDFGANEKKLDIPAKSGSASTNNTFVIRLGSGSGTVVSSPAGINCSTSGSCKANFPIGTRVTLTATPNSGSAFTNWEEPVYNLCSAMRSCTFTVDSRSSSTIFYVYFDISAVIVNKASQTVSFGAAPTIVAGGVGTVSATTTSGLAVNFTSATPNVCTVSGSTVTGVIAGTCTVAANQAGNTSYNSAAQVTQNITISMPANLASFTDNFDGTSLSSTYWTPNRYTDGTTAPGTLSVYAGILNFGCKSLADTGGKYHFSGNQIIIEGGFAGTGSLRDTRVTLIEAADSSNAIHAGDTNYQGQGLYTAGSGTFTLSQTGIGNSTSAYKEYRLTITGASLTWERGDTLANITERTIRTLPVSIAGKIFILSIGTGGPDYCPGSFDWVRITSDSATTGTTTTTVTSTGTAVEFYNNNLDNYFITADANEAAQIDGGAAGSGWSRTGYTFKSGGNTSVCRFYGSYSPGPNSHFYTVDPAECQGLKDQQISAGDPRKLTDKSWNFESLDFVSTPPSNNTCPTGTTPVYRAYNNGFSRGIDSNHRITTSLTAIGEVVTRGWSNEGVVMCAPM